MKLLRDLIEAADVLMRHYGLRRKDLVERRTMIGGNPWLARNMPHRYVTRHCRNLECDTCPSTEHHLYCTHWCHYEEEKQR